MQKRRIHSAAARIGLIALAAFLLLASAGCVPGGSGVFPADSSAGSAAGEVNDMNEMSGTNTATETSGSGKESFRNPLIPPEGADPWVIFHDGYYYYCFSENDGLFVTKARNLYEIGTETPVRVYTPPAEGEFTADYWAPELHYLEGKWVIYVAADDGQNENHRMIALESSTGDPQGTYVFRGKVSDPSDKWAIDGTAMTINGKLYFVWSGWEGDVNVVQNLYIAPMSDPFTISGSRVRISRPEYGWETVGDPQVNEGPEALTAPSGTIHIVYSASGSWTDDYCLGLLTLAGEDPLDPASWVKADKPVFSKAKSAYGPGHASFTAAPDGENWIVYHACKTPGGGWAARSVRAQPFSWDGDTPVFGKPAPLTEKQEIARNPG